MSLYQYGITADTGRWAEYRRQLREWLGIAQGPTSIPYRIEGLDPGGVYPRVLTAAPVRDPDGRFGFVYGHVIDLEDSLLIAGGKFEDDDCPKLNFFDLTPPSR